MASISFKKAKVNTKLDVMKNDKNEFFYLNLINKRHDLSSSQTLHIPDIVAGVKSFKHLLLPVQCLEP